MDDLPKGILTAADSMSVFADGEPTFNYGWWRKWCDHHKKTGHWMEPSVFKELMQNQESNQQMNQQNKAPDLLHKAAEIMEERGKQYDKPEGERSMAQIVAAFNAVTKHNLSEADGWEFMALVKQVRLFQNRSAAHRDSFEDLIAYSALLGECAANQGLNPHGQT